MRGGGAERQLPEKRHNNNSSISLKKHYNVYTYLVINILQY
jgi:hypothetical protein